MSIVYNIEYLDNGVAYGQLTWMDTGLTTLAASGPYGRGELPEGLYHCRRAMLLDKDGKPGFCDSLNNCWMQVIEPQFSTIRTGLGIHPDGNKSGTKGCIGIVDSNTKPWFEAFKRRAAGTILTIEVFSNL